MSSRERFGHAAAIARAAVAVAALVMAAPARLPAQEPAVAPPQPSAPGSGPLSLAAAVDETLRHSFTLAQEKAKVADRHGVWMETAGAFDPTLFLNGRYSSVREELIFSEVTNEIKRRVPAEFAAIARPEGPPGALDYAADLIGQGVPQAAALIVPQCSDFDTQFVVDAGAEGSVTLCLDSANTLHGVVLSDLSASGEDLDRLIATLAVLEQLGSDFQAQIQDSVRQLLLDTIDVLRAFADALRQQRARLGGLPIEQELQSFDLDVGNRWLLRNGTLVTLSLGLTGTGFDFSGKQRDPAFGGPDSPETFTTTAALQANVPLGKGRGRLATAGPLEAAKIAWGAEQDLLLHTAASEALRTAQAYWSLAAAQERLRLLEQSLATNQRIGKLARTLVDGGELAGAELHRVDSRVAEAARQVADARGALAGAQVDLARAMGESIARTADAPLAADSVPAITAADAMALTAAPAAAAGWLDAARTRRYDVEAAAKATRATALLRDVARANLRRPVDFVARLSYNGLSESFHTRVWDVGGYWDAARGHVSGPSYAVGLRVTWPFANSTARGQLLQAESTLTQSEIQQGDLLRQIKLRLDGLAAERAHLMAEATDRAAALDALTRTLDASFERFRLGDITLIDLLTTESQLTDSRLSLLAAERDLAQLDAQIRFESGTLLTAPPSEESDPAELHLAATPLTMPNPTP